MRSIKILTLETPTDVVICDPCYFIPNDKWSGSHYGEELPFAHITEDTGAGDGLFYVVDAHSGIAIGTFAADTGQTTVAALDDVLEYNPEAFKGIQPDCYCVVHDFIGTIQVVFDGYSILCVSGHGNVDFESRPEIRRVSK